MLRRAQSALLFAGSDGAQPLADYLSAPADAPQLQSIPG